jgi:hypothetical protein
VTSGKSPACFRASSARMRGVSRSSQNVGQEMRWTLVLQETNARTSGRRSRGVLIPRRWYQPADDADASRRGWWQESPITRETTKETVKTIARGMPDVSGVTVVTTLVCLFYFACEAAGASSARHSLRPLTGGRELSGQTRAKCAARSRSRVFSLAPFLRGEGWGE